MGKNAPCQGVLATEKLINDLSEALYGQVQGLLMKERFSHGDNFEKLYGSAQNQVVFSIRLNQKKRLLLTKHELDGQCYWVLLDYLENHEYHRSKFLHGRGLKDYFALPRTLALLRQSRDKQNLPAASAAAAASASSTPVSVASSAPGGGSCGDSKSNNDQYDTVSSTTTTSSTSSEPSTTTPTTEAGGAEGAVNHHELRFFNDNLIVLSTAQDKALTLQEPMLLTGMPGSGKSCVALSYIGEWLNRTPLNAAPLLYVTESELLAKSMRDTFLASPLGQSELAKRVVFASYGELALNESPKLRDLKKVEHTDFTTWFTASNDKQVQMLQTWLGPKAAELVYQELRMMSALDMRQYQSLGERESPLFNLGSFPEELGGGKAAGSSAAEPDAKAKDKLRGSLFDIKQKYSNYLERNGQYDVSFETLGATGKYSHIAVDEAQDFSTKQLANLHALAQKNKEKPGIAFFADSNQSVKDNFPKQNFFKTILGITQIGELPGTFRCSQAVAQVANTVLGIKYHLTGGAMEKGVQAFIEHSEDTAEGSACIIPETHEKQNAETQKNIAALIATPHCVVITPEEEIAHAKKRFPGAIVLTPKQAKGLEYKAVILYRMLDRPYYRNMNPLLADYQQRTAGAKVHRAKSGQAHYEYNAPLNELFTAMTRAREHLFIMHDTHSEKALHHIKHLVHHLKNVVSNEPAPSMTTSVPSVSKLDWEEEMERQLKQGNREVALGIAVDHLRISADDFNRRYPVTPSASISMIRQTPHLESKENTTGLERKGNIARLEKKERKREQQPSKPQDVSAPATSTVSQPKSQQKKSLATIATSQASSAAKVTDAMRAVMVCENPTFDLVPFKALNTLMQQKNLGEQLFCIDVGNGKSLFESLSNELQKLLVSILKKPDFAKKIELEHLCQARDWAKPNVKSSLLYNLVRKKNGAALLTNLLDMNPEWVHSSLFKEALYTPLPKEAGQDVNATSLYWFCGMPEGRKLLEKLISANPKLVVTEEFMKALCRPRPSVATGDENTTGLFYLCSNSDGQKILSKLIAENPQMINEDFMRALCRARPIAAGKQVNASGLYWLCFNTPGQILLEKIVAANLSLFATESFIDALCLVRPAAAESDENTTALFHLCKEPVGQIVLGRLIAENPRIANDKFRATLSLPATAGPSGNETALSRLCLYTEGLTFLNKLFTDNPHWVDEDFITAICLARTKAAQSKESETGLLYLCGFPDGRILLKKLFAANPHLFTSEAVMTALCLPLAGENENTTALYYLCSTPEGQEMVSKLITDNPGIVKDNFITTLCRALPATAGVHENHTVLSTLCSYPAGKSLLNKLFAENPHWVNEDLITALCLPLTEAAEEQEGQSALYLLCQSSPDSRIWLEKHISDNPRLFATEAFMTALCRPRPAKAQANANTSGLYWLCQSAEGRALLEQIISTNPSLVNDDFFAALSRARSAAAGKEENDNILYSLFCTPTRLKFLATLIANNLQRVNEDFITTLCLARTEASGDLWKTTGLYWFCVDAEGQILLRQLISAKPHLFATEVFMTALCTARANGDYENDSGLFSLCLTLEGKKILSTLIELNHDLVASEVFFRALTLQLKTTNKKYANKSALSVLQESVEGQALLAMMAKYNRDLQLALSLEDKEPPTQKAGISAEKNAGSRYRIRGLSVRNQPQNQNTAEKAESLIPASGTRYDAKENKEGNNVAPETAVTEVNRSSPKLGVNYPATSAYPTSFFPPAKEAVDSRSDVKSSASSAP